MYPPLYENTVTSYCCMSISKSMLVKANSTVPSVSWMYSVSE